MRAMAEREELVDSIASFGLFSDLSNPQLEGIVHLFEEAVFSDGEKVLRQGLTGSGFYVILDGEAAVVVDGTERARLGRGEFFGEVSIILGESPIADIVATRPLRCLMLAGPRVESFLIAHPRVMYRMLQVQARRLRAANRWRS
jgi:CRP-like cAMP-binding protein